MLSQKDFLQMPIYEIEQSIKEDFLLKNLKSLTKHHIEKCEKYRKIILSRNVDIEKIDNLNKLPYIPVSLFKNYELKSIPQSNIFKTLLSSGTTNQNLSKIFLDTNTANIQSTALIKILQNLLGKSRLPMLIIDHDSIIKDRSSFSARGAGIVGLFSFGHNHTYALNEDMSLNIKKIEDFFQKFSKQPCLIIGFTYIIWEYFLKYLEKNKLKFNFQESIMLHSGGWKKLTNISVNNETFKACVYKNTGINKIHNYYGMVEQVGSIFVECEEGFLHPPIFSDVIIRDKINLKPLKINNTGIVQVNSCLPKSYPGHILLTEDVGIIHGIDDCKCGRKGKYFSIQRRLKKAELRGCSDTFEE